MKVLEKVPLGELMRQPVSSLDPKDHKNEMFNYYSIPAYDEGKPFSELGKEIGSSKKVLQKGDVLISRIVPHIRRVWIVGEDEKHTNIGSSEWIVFNTDKAIPEYLRYFLLSDVFHNQFMKTITGVGGSLMRANKKQTERINIPICTIEEQKAIVAKLDRAQRLIDIDREMLAKYDELIQSVFLEMFGDPVRNSVEDENTLELEKLVKFKGGGTPSKKNKEFWNGDIPWVSPKDMKWTYINDSQDKITSAAIEESSTKLIKRSAVLSVVRSGILKNTWPLAINTVDVTLNQDMKALICSERINNYFLLYYLKNYSRKILGSVRGTTADNISTAVFKKIPIKLPELEKQLKFRDVVKTIEKEKTDTKIDKSEELFSSLVQEVFG